MSRKFGPKVLAEDALILLLMDSDLFEMVELHCAEDICAAAIGLLGKFSIFPQIYAIKLT